MVNLITFINNLINETKSSITPAEVIMFLEDHNWMSERPDYSKKTVELDEIQEEAFREPIRRFLTNEGSTEYLMAKFQDKFPDTGEKIEKFLSEVEFTDFEQYCLLDFLLFRLHKELIKYDNEDVKTLLVFAYKDLSMKDGNNLTFFLDWIISSYKGIKFKSHYLKPRCANNPNNEAYDMEDYLRLTYYLFNPTYIEKENMFRKAAESKNYCDTWLYMSLHFICALRFTDLEKIDHPYLPKPPEVVLSEIKTGEFSDEDAVRVLKSIVSNFEYLNIVPNKTSRFNNVESIKFHVPISCEVFFGTLFAAAEAHWLMGKRDQPLIRNISTYQEIKRHMGNEIGELFRYRNFHSRSVTKSYLQSIFILSDDILDESASIKGYILASHARSHKGDPFTFISDVTATYLKDGKFTGMTAENIAYQFVERGVLSCTVSYMLKMLPSVNYDTMKSETQTELQKSLGFSPKDAESTVTAVIKARQDSRDLALNIFNEESTETIYQALERIVSGTAFSKQTECYCLLTALGKKCSIPESTQCIGCRYEILTKATLFYLVGEYKRISKLYKQSSDSLEKNKWKSMAQKLIIPKIEEMLICFKENYPKEIYEAYEAIVEGELNG